MGDPKKQKKKFHKPSHPWNKERIILEKEILKEYGLKRKREIMMMNTFLKNLLHQAKGIIGSRTQQSEVEKRQLLTKVHRYGLLQKNAKVEDILNLELKRLLERRLQTLVLRKNLANTILQARHFIVHEHISIGDKKITSPSYLVKIEEESLIRYADDSLLKNVKSIKSESKENKKTEVK